MIGAGSGIAPFLAFLDEEQIQTEYSKNTSFRLNKYTDYEKAHLVFISRDVDQFSWISPYLDKILEGESIDSLKKLKLHIFLTMKKKIDTLASFLFWRSFKLYEARKLESTAKDIEGGSIYVNPLTDGPVQITLGRPNFDKLFKEIAI